MGSNTRAAPSSAVKGGADCTWGSLVKDGGWVLQYPSTPKDWNMKHRWKISSGSHNSKGKSHQVAVSATGSGFLSQPKESCKSNFYSATACSLGTFWKSTLCRRKPLQHLQKLRVFGENHPFHRFLASDESLNKSPVATTWTHQTCRSPSTCLPCWTHQPLNRSSYSKMLWPCWCADVLGLQSIQTTWAHCFLLTPRDPSTQHWKPYMELVVRTWEDKELHFSIEEAQQHHHHCPHHQNTQWPLLPRVRKEPSWDVTFLKISRRVFFKKKGWQPVEIDTFHFFTLSRNLSQQFMHI